jgi:hypothetical protein
VTTTDRQDLTDLGPQYHEYSFFGATGTQLEGHFVGNQRAKAPIITAYIAYAIAKSREYTDDVSFIELFCADAYYAMVAGRLGALSTTGVDNNRDKHSDAAMEIARRLGIDGFRMLDMDISRISRLAPADVVANVGGLYHVENPVDVLRDSYALARRYLIVQNVVSLANTDPDYFETPAPGWTWGSRFSRASFDALIRSQGWNIVDHHENELTGNDRDEDRGSMYYLIAK